MLSFCFNLGNYKFFTIYCYRVRRTFIREDQGLIFLNIG